MTGWRGMPVPRATARYRSETARGPVYCCRAGCKERFDREPGRYPFAARA